MIKYDIQKPAMTAPFAARFRSIVVVLIFKYTNPGNKLTMEIRVHMNAAPGDFQRSISGIILASSKPIKRGKVVNTIGNKAAAIHARLTRKEPTRCHPFSGAK